MFGVGMFDDSDGLFFRAETKKNIDLIGCRKGRKKQRKKQREDKRKGTRRRGGGEGGRHT